jgi:Questin oxidase-like
MLRDDLTNLLRDHRDAHAPHYPPHDNSDHGPMAYLAMYGLGIGTERIQQFAKTYRARLAPLAQPGTVVDRANWGEQLGRPDAYPSLLVFFDAQIAANGWQSTVQEFLPTLISGWVKDAFHPLIRLGYGIEFEANCEIAAGLAYLTSIGNDAKLAELARRSPSVNRGRHYFERLQSQRRATFSRGPFNARYERIVNAADLHPADGSLDNVLREFGRASLEVFHATHDFFALHLVTASHAFRICSHWAGNDLVGLYSVGLAAAYLAIGAPAFQALTRLDGELPGDALATATDEHDLKLAYSCRAQARAFGDPTYEWCAANYLTPRLSRTR